MGTKCSNCPKGKYQTCEYYEPKMDAKEAIEELRLSSLGEWVPNKEAVKVAIQALEKQVPRKSIQKENSALGDPWHCPNCGDWIDPSTYKFCPDCGQAIKKE